MLVVYQHGKIIDRLQVSSICKHVTMASYEAFLHDWYGGDLKVVWEYRK